MDKVTQICNLNNNLCEDVKYFSVIIKGKNVSLTKLRMISKSKEKFRREKKIIQENKPRPARRSPP